MLCPGLTLLGGVELGGAMYTCRYCTATTLIALLCYLARIVFVFIAFGPPFCLFWYFPGRPNSAIINWLPFLFFSDEMVTRSTWQVVCTVTLVG